MPELDILRFFAFFAVFIHHVLPQNSDLYQGPLAKISLWIGGAVRSGGFGVDLFFALSSFLISELLIREYEKTNKIDVIAFYKRRALRILPLYYTFVFMSLFLFPRLFENESLNYPYNIGFLTIFANWTCAFWGYPTSVAAPLWSISIEEQFYLVFPFMVMFFGIKHLKVLAFSFIGIATITRFVMLFFETPPTGVWCNTFARLDPIAGGILLTVLLRNKKLRPIENRGKQIFLCLFSIIVCILAATYLNIIGPSSILLYPIVALASVLIILSVISPENKNLKKYSKLIYLGKISYGLYVFHILGIRLSILLLDNLIPSLKDYLIVHLIVHFLVALLLTIIMAIVSYNVLEKPFLMLKKRFTYVKSRPA